LIEPLLLTARSAGRKYGTELPQILSNGAGPEKLEEVMMWYALKYEPSDDSREMTEEHRVKWFQRLERRE
jgi:hypothetical protein